MLPWFRSLTGTERRTLAACFGGWALDAFDGQIYTFTAPVLLTLWGVSHAQLGVLGTATLVASAFGGWIAGVLCDRFGRLRILQFTILWYAVFTFLSGFADNFSQLLVCRTLQGLGYGGEWVAGAVLIGEVIRGQYRGRAVGIVQSGFAAGWGAAALLSSLVFSVAPPEYAWRVLFWIGLCPALLVLWIRQHLQESPRFVDERIDRSRVRLVDALFGIFDRRHLSSTLRITVMVIGAQGGFTAVSVWLPTYLQTDRGIPGAGVGVFMLVLILGGFCGFLTGAFLADRVGRKATFALTAVAAALMVSSYMLLPISDRVRFFLGFPLGFFASANFAPMGAFMTEMYPTDIRGTGQGFCYNAGRGIGAAFPALVGFATGTLLLGEAIAVFSVCGYALMLIAVLTLPETKGRDLEWRQEPRESPVRAV